MNDGFTSFEESRGSLPSMAQRIAGLLREDIAAGILMPGEMLPPGHAVMQRFGVSRPTCREALRILRSEGLIEIVRGNKGGARVRAPDPRQLGAYAGVLLQMRNATIVEVYEARRLVVGRAGRSGPRGTDRREDGAVQARADSDHSGS